MILTICLLGQITYAGQGEGTCKAKAEKVASLLFVEGQSLEAMNGVQVETLLLNVSNVSRQSQWSVTFSSPEADWYTVFTVETIDYSEDETGCSFKYVSATASE